MIGCSYVLPLAAKIFFQVASTSPATKSTNLPGSSAGAFSQLGLRRLRSLRQGAGAGIDAEAAPAAGQAADEQIDDEEDDQADPAAARLPHRQGNAAAAEAAAGSAPVLDPSAAAASAPLHGGDHSPADEFHAPRRTLRAMAQAPALPRGFELPLEPRLPRIGSVDAVALEERAATLAKRSIKKDSKLQAYDLAVRMMDLTTLEGADTPGKVAALCSKAMRPGPGRPVRAAGRGRLRLPEPRPDREGAARRLERQGRVGRDRVPVRPVAARGQARRRARGGRARRRRGRHGDRPRRLPLRPLRQGLRRDRQGEGGLRRRRT